MSALIPTGHYFDWTSINEWVRQQLGFEPDSKVQIRSYHSPEACLIDELLTFIQFYSHKRSVYVHRGVSPIFEEIIPHLLRDTLKVHSVLTDESLTDQAKQDAFLSGLAPDTNSVVLCANHWVTKEKFPLDHILQFLENKKIYTLVINHGDAELARIKPGSFTTYIHTFGEIHFAAMGSRWKNPTLLSWQGNWNLETFKKQWTRELTNIPNKEIVKNFESQFIENAFFTDDRERVFDRASLTFLDVNADLVASELAKKMNWSTEEKNYYTGTLNGCDVPNYPSLRTWWRPEPNEKVLRGFLQISVLALQKFPNLAGELKSILTRLKQEQTWTLP